MIINFAVNLVKGILKLVTQYFTHTVKLYSSSLFTYAIENNLVSKILEDIEKIENNLLSDESLIKSIAAPIFSEDEQHQIISSITAKLKLVPETINFIDLLAKNKRLKLLKNILDLFKILAIESSGTKIVDVTLSENLSSAKQDAVKLQLENILASNLIINFKQDPAIISGIIVKFNNKMLDASLKTKFTNLTNAMAKEIALL
ncbi:MAG: ATP synthase F1 subunit delta [Rickettsiales bacterium]